MAYTVLLMCAKPMAWHLNTSNQLSLASKLHKTASCLLLHAGPIPFRAYWAAKPGFMACPASRAC
ncbi:hypothetical protein PanWU01x14_280370 [Parasponia andersonii]|uniref:Uncharacterized protein n=1 Tax=Parasponia andersonii TaxID=3476 RepID=A0A2P5B1I6_PARAD|nr:hypothetical protein PanWU01x14_280370 [Parasponia andersonii]